MGLLSVRNRDYQSWIAGSTPVRSTVNILVQIIDIKAIFDIILVDSLGVSVLNGIQGKNLAYGEVFNINIAFG